MNKPDIDARLAGALIALAILGGCTTVSPSERGTLSRLDMQWDTDLARTVILEHSYPSKEAASGGRATGGGGCGCN
ncbi:MAG TPA: DUF4266 domain-containing protein [Usitatibacteraceae bacterium]|nr:DUF4266 domain-containing protein [Usitatibacteraceae bacterium]